MLVRLCDRCGTRIEDGERSLQYRATVTTAEGEIETFAEYRDLCVACVEELRRAHTPFRRKQRRAAKERSTVGFIRRLSKQESRRLKSALVAVVREQGGCATSRQIMDGIAKLGLPLPGRHPSRNLTSYLSRHPLIENVRPGLWRLKAPVPSEGGSVEGPADVVTSSDVGERHETSK